jgi:hypothetical protein
LFFTSTLYPCQRKNRTTQKSKNVEIKEKSCFTNKNIRIINNKISSIKIPDNLPFLLALVFAVPVYIIFLFKMWYYAFELIGNYLLMFIFPEKYKEKKMFCYCKDCGKVSIIQE